MAMNVYVMPAVVTTGDLPARFPKYFAPGQPFAAYNWVGLDYGVENVFLVAAADVTAADQSTLAGFADVIAVPPLSQTVGAQVTTVQSRLESLNIPGQWVTSSMSYGSVCRYTAVFMTIMQTLTQQMGRPSLFQGTGITLATKWGQLPAAVQQNLLDLAAHLNMSTAALTGTTTVRQVLKALADQWPAVAIPVGGTVL